MRNPDTAVPSAVINVGQIGIRYLIDGAATGGMGMFELTVPPGSMVPPPHRHTRNEECVYVLEGTFRYTVAGVERDLGPGEWMLSPRDSVPPLQQSARHHSQSTHRHQP